MNITPITPITSIITRCNTHARNLAKVETDKDITNRDETNASNPDLWAITDKAEGKLHPQFFA